jgi:hypothetical protein
LLKEECNRGFSSAAPSHEKTLRAIRVESRPHGRSFHEEGWILAYEVVFGERMAYARLLYGILRQLERSWNLVFRHAFLE